MYYTKNLFNMETLSWDEFRKNTFISAMEIVGNSNCSTFKLIGYKHLNVRLILYFDDCHQVFDFQNGVERKSFFTKDFTHDEHLISVVKFKEEINFDKPE